MTSYTVKRYQSSYKSAWNRFLYDSKNATFLFDRNFMDYHADRFKDYSLLVFKDENLVGLLPAHLENRTLYSHNGLTYGGLVFNKNVSFGEAKKIFQSILEFLEQVHIDFLKIKLLPRIYHKLPADEIDYLLFLVRAKSFRTDITASIENANRLPVTSSNRLRGIKRAIKNNLKIREETDFSSFWNSILKPNLMAAHNQKPVHSLEEIHLLHKRFPENIRQFSIYKDEEIVGGTTLFITDRVVHAQYIAAGETGRKTGALDYLFSELFKIFKEIKYFDFGIVNEMQGKKVNKGLLEWKESFGARTIVHQFFEIETSRHHLLNSLYL